MPPAKRYKSSSSAIVRSSPGGGSLYARRGKNKTNYKTWPYQSRATYARMWDPFPATQMVRMRYSETISLAPNAGITAYNLFKCGSIFDPNQSGVGHQPYGHDTYATIYNHYRVMRSTITMTCNNGAGGHAGISIKDDTTVEGSYDTVREAKGTNFVALNPTGAHNKLVQYYSERMLPDTARNSALMGQNPADDMYFMCWYQGQTATATPNTATFVVTITYDCYLYELKDLGQS